MFCRRYALLIFFGVLFFWGKLGFAQAITYQAVTIGHAHTYVVIADLDSPNINVGLYISSKNPNNREFPHESFGSMVSKSHPTAAIDGTYYDTRNFMPVGTLVRDGQMVQQGNHGVSVCFDENNRVSFYKIHDLKNFPWQKFKVVISTGPTLLEEGRVHLYPGQERFHDPMLFRPASRSAIGVTAHHKLLLVSVRNAISLRQLAIVMQKLGAIEAVSLDGGSSTGLYYRGKYLIHPSRSLTNIFVVNEREFQKEPRVSQK